VHIAGWRQRRRSVQLEGAVHSALGHLPTAGEKQVNIRRTAIGGARAQFVKNLRERSGAALDDDLRRDESRSILTCDIASVP
jgi:hypothetical protein